MKKLNRHVLRQALDAIPAPALIIDAQTRERTIVYLNAAAGRSLGAHPNELLGRPAEALALTALDPALPHPWQLRATDGSPVAFRPEPMYEQPGRASYWLLTAVSGQPAADSGSGGESGTGMSTGMYLNTDIWLRGARDERTDLTTGIPGRNALLEILLRDWSAARRDQRRLSVLVFRIDALESYHSLFGRHATDACLRKVAHAIANSLQRAADFCARVGHDRFAVLVGDTDEERAAQFAERIAQRVRDLAIHHPRSQLARYVTVSWSIASEVPRPGAEEPCLLEEAESHVTGRAAPAPTADSTVQSAGSPASR